MPQGTPMAVLSGAAGSGGARRRQPAAPRHGGPIFEDANGRPWLSAPWRFPAAVWYGAADRRHGMVPPIGGTGNGACNCRHGTPPADPPAAGAGGGGARFRPGNRRAGGLSGRNGARLRPGTVYGAAWYGAAYWRHGFARRRKSEGRQGPTGPCRDAGASFQGRPANAGRRWQGESALPFWGARSAAAVAARFGAAIAAWTGATFAACCPAAIAAGRLGGLGAGRVPARRAAGTGRRQCCGRDVRRGLGRGIRRATGFCGAGVWAAERPPAQPKRCQVVSPTGFPSWDRLSTTPQNRFDRFDSARTLSRHYRSGRRNRAGGQIECF